MMGAGHEENVLAWTFIINGSVISSQLCHNCVKEYHHGERRISYNAISALSL